MKIVDREYPAEILVVEDQEDDVLILSAGFKKAGFTVNISHVENGKECMSFLRKEGRYVSSPTPDLVFLDLNMPIMDGHETLAAIMDEPGLRKLPIIVLTTSSYGPDFDSAYDLRCASCLTKPVDFSQFKKLAETVASYWLSFVELPNSR